MRRFLWLSILLSALTVATSVGAQDTLKPNQTYRDVIRLTFSSGSTQVPFASVVNRQGTTSGNLALWKVIQKGDAAVRGFIAKGADINAKEKKGKTALMFAAHSKFKLRRSRKKPGLGDKRATLPLYESKVRRLWWGAMLSIHDVPQAKREIISRQVRQVMQSGQKVIRCTYGPRDTVKRRGFQIYKLWYEDVPNNIYDMLSVAPRIHPMWHLGLKSVTVCPESSAHAGEVRMFGKRLKYPRGTGHYVERCRTIAAPRTYDLGNTYQKCKLVWELLPTVWILKKDRPLPVIMNENPDARRRPRPD